MKIIFSLLMLFTYSLFASPSMPAHPPVLKIGVIHSAPYAFIKNDKNTGLSVELWEKIAERLNLPYEFIQLGQDTDKGVNLLKEHQIDVLIGSFEPSYNTSQIIDFSAPYAISKYSVVVKTAKTDIWANIQKILTQFSITLIILSVIALILYSHIIWAFERHQHDVIPKSYFKGMSLILWKILLRQKIVDFPVTITGRLTQFIWLVIGTSIISGIYALVASYISLHLIVNQVNWVDSDLNNKTILAVQDSPAFKRADEDGLHVIPFLLVIKHSKN